MSRNAGQQIIVIPGASRGTGREAAHVFAGGRADGVLAARSRPTLGSLPPCLATPKARVVVLAGQSLYAARRLRSDCRALSGRRRFSVLARDTNHP